jgi:hypothetical protein
VVPFARPRLYFRIGQYHQRSSQRERCCELHRLRGLLWPRWTSRPRPPCSFPLPLTDQRPAGTRRRLSSPNAAESPSECRSWGYRGRTPACICYVCNGCGDSCDIRVVTPDLGDADDEPSFLVGESDADSPDSGGCVSPALSLPSWRAAPCGSVPIVFRENEGVMRRIRTIRALLGVTVVAGGMAALTPRGAGFHSGGVRRGRSRRRGPPSQRHLSCGHPR